MDELSIALEIMDHRAIIDLWPSVAELARDLEVGPARVYKWHTRRSIPGDFWFDMVELAKDRDISLDIEDLARAAKERAA